MHRKEMYLFATISTQHLVTVQSHTLDNRTGPLSLWLHWPDYGPIHLHLVSWTKMRCFTCKPHISLHLRYVRSFAFILNTHTHTFNLNLLTYLLIPWCRVLLEKLTGLQLVKKFTAFHGTPRFITALTTVCRLSLSWARSIQSIYSHPTSWRSILILSNHLHLGLPSGLLPSGFPSLLLFWTL